MLSTTVIHLIKCEGLDTDQKKFLKDFFRLKTDDEFNINKPLIDISFVTRTKFLLGDKAKQILIFYHSSRIRLKPLKTDFIQIINSIDDIDRFNVLLTDNRFHTIGNSEIAKLSTYEISRINNLIRKFYSSVDQKSNIRRI